MKILPIHHVIPLVFLMPKWKSPYCISLSSWRMLVIEGIQIAIVPLLQRAHCVEFLTELPRYRQGLAQTQGCAQLCLTCASNGSLVEFISSGWFCLRLGIQSLQYFPCLFGPSKHCLEIVCFACLLYLLSGKMLWRCRDTYLLCWWVSWQMALHFLLLRQGVKTCSCFSCLVCVM